MLVKGILWICIQAILVKAVITLCIGRYPGERILSANMPLVDSYNEGGRGPIAPFYGRVIGGNLILDTKAPYAATGPAGVTIFSDDLLIEGVVVVTGNLPFLGTVALEGIVPAAGNSAVSYECGSGNVGIVNDGVPVASQIVPVSGLGPGLIESRSNVFGLGRL